MVSPDIMLVLEFVGGVSLSQVARVTGSRAGSSVCVANSRVLFSEDLLCGMSLGEDGREIDISFFAVSWVLSDCPDFQKRLEEKVVER